MPCPLGWPSLQPGFRSEGFNMEREKTTGASEDCDARTDVPSSSLPATSTVDYILQRLQRALQVTAQELRQARACYEELVEATREACRPTSDQSPCDELTLQERRVAALGAVGKSNSEIAALLHLSEHTVKSHMKSVLRKLKLRSRWQLTGSRQSPAAITHVAGANAPARTDL